MQLETYRRNGGGREAADAVRASTGMPEPAR
jgi:hypothetical protein